MQELGAPPGPLLVQTKEESLLARFVSKYRAYSITGRPQRTMVLATGQKQVLEHRIICDFKVAGSDGMGGLSPWEKEAALSHFNFGAKGHDEDVSRRLSVYDTEAAQMQFGWDDETREFIEDRLRSANGNGIDFIEVEPPRVATPWPSYDDLTDADEIAFEVGRLGFDIGYVISYEQQNKNRPEVIAALEALAAGGGEAPAAEEVVRA